MCEQLLLSLKLLRQRMDVPRFSLHAPVLQAWAPRWLLVESPDKQGLFG